MEKSLKNATERVANEEPNSRMAYIKKITKIEWKSTSHSVNGSKETPPIELKQVIDVVLKNMELKLFGIANEGGLPMSNCRCKHYEAAGDRNNFTDSPLLWMYNKSKDFLNFYQLPIVRKHVNEVLFSPKRFWNAYQSH